MPKIKKTLTKRDKLEELTKVKKPKTKKLTKKEQKELKKLKEQKQKDINTVVEISSRQLFNKYFKERVGNYDVSSYRDLIKNKDFVRDLTNDIEDQIELHPPESIQRRVFENMLEKLKANPLTSGGARGDDDDDDKEEEDKDKRSFLDDLHANIKEREKMSDEQLEGHREIEYNPLTTTSGVSSSLVNTDELQGSGKSHLIQRMGSKTNDIKYFRELLPMDVKIVVEPFGGSFALIRDVYFDKKYKKYVNDLDTNIFYIYKNPNKLISALEIWNKINEKNINAKQKIEMLKKTHINPSIKDYIEKTMIVKGQITQSKNLDNVKEDLDLIKQITFTNKNAFDIIEKFRKNKNAFIFLDPPYLFSNNQSYLPQSQNEDMTHYYLKFLKILEDPTTKAKIMLVINSLGIAKELYKKFVKMEYDKIYQVGKKQSKHLVITNYDQVSAGKSEKPKEGKEYMQWGTITLHIPKNMLYFTGKKAQLQRIKDTLTESGHFSKANGIDSINVKQTNENKAYITDEGNNIIKVYGKEEKKEQEEKEKERKEEEDRLNLGVAELVAKEKKEIQEIIDKHTEGKAKQNKILEIISGIEQDMPKKDKKIYDRILEDKKLTSKHKDKLSIIRAGLGGKRRKIERDILHMPKKEQKIASLTHKALNAIIKRISSALN